MSFVDSASLSEFKAEPAVLLFQLRTKVKASAANTPGVELVPKRKVKK